MTQQLHVAGLPQAIEDGYFDTANANKSWVRVHGGQSSEFPIYPTTLERTISVGSVCVRVWKRDCDVTSLVEHRVKSLQQNGPWRRRLIYVS